MAAALNYRRCLSFPVFLVAGMMLFGYVVYELTTPGQFSNWSEWSACSRTCGDGQRRRTRNCDKPTPGPLGKGCSGKSINLQKCKLFLCPINGGYNEWSKFGACDKACGGGKRTRGRTCTNPLPLYGGKTCASMSAEESQACNVNPCPVNGGYSEWGSFTACEIVGEKHCGKGKKVRTRTCNKPVPQYGGKNCEGPDKENADCEVPCPTTMMTTANTTSNATFTIAPTTKPKQ